MEGRMRRYVCSTTSPERMRGESDPPPATWPEALLQHRRNHQYHYHYQNQNGGNQKKLQLRQGMKIEVVYYLCRNQHFDHPHFIEVPISSPCGLFLKDVIDRLNMLRGKGMAALYSWSCKRSYNNRFVWHDLSEDDIIVPTPSNEYVLKGSELLDDSRPPPPLPSRTPKLLQNANDHHQDPSIPAPPQTPFRPPPPPSPQSREDDLPFTPPNLGHSCSSSWNASLKSNKPNSSSQGSGGSPSLSPSTSTFPSKYKLHNAASSDKSTQTDDKHRLRTPHNIKKQTTVDHHHHHSNNNNEEISESLPLTTSIKKSLPGRKGETLESLIRADPLKRKALLSNLVSASKVGTKNGRGGVGRWSLEASIETVRHRRRLHRQSALKCPHPAHS